MTKKILLALLLLLSPSCVKISAGKPVSARAPFVTSTLPPTKFGLALPTDTPTLPPTSTLQVSNVDVTSTPPCKDGAILLADVSYPDNTRLTAGEKFTKTWKLQNAGSCKWAGYTATFISGDKMEAPASVSVPETEPKATVEVSVALVAPSKDGTFTGNFELRNAAGQVIPIGTERSFWVKIVVGNGASQVSNSERVIATIKPTNFSQCNYSENTGYVQELIGLINQARAEARVPTLTVNAQLTAAAQGHSVDMACGNFLSHSGSDGSYISDRVRAAEYPGYGASEIIAIGTPQDAMRQWRDDPGHWEFVLNPYTIDIGVGYAYSASSDFGGYFTVDFSTP